MSRIPAAPKPVWLWSSRTGLAPVTVDRLWQAFLRRFDLETSKPQCCHSRGRPAGVAAAWQDGRMSFALRAATVADIDGLLGMWQEAAENATRLPDQMFVRSLT